jgi:hypothetical protein
MKHWFLLGGFVVPNLNEIDDDVSYQKTVKQFSTFNMVTINFIRCSNIMGWLYNAV